MLFIVNKFAVFFCSSNGKSWGSNERSYRPNLWKRMSFHVKKKDPVEMNQTAIIKPFSKGGEAPEDSVKKLYEEPQVSQSFSCSPSQSPLPNSSLHLPKVRGLKEEEGSEEVQVFPTYVPEHPLSVRRRGGENSQVSVVMDGEDVSIISVGDIGQTQGTTIMDQISSVVNRFTANISELNTMMLPGGAIVSPPSSTALPAAAVAAVDADTPLCPPQHLNKHAPFMVTTHAEVTSVSSFCDNRPAAKIYEHLAGTCVSGRRAKNAEELMALTPPSPFRDSSLSSEGSSPPSLSPASEAEYNQLLRHYSQSSSSL